MDTYISLFRDQYQLACCKYYTPAHAIMLSFHNGFLWFLLGDKQPLPWEMRVRVAYYIAQALDHCNTENRKIYHDLNAYRILFDEVCL